MSEFRKYDTSGLCDADHTIWGWIAWYSNGSSYNSRTTKWTDLPKDGIMCAQSYENWTNNWGAHRALFFKGTGFYWQDPKTDMKIYRAKEKPTNIPEEYVKNGEENNFEHYDKAVDQSDDSKLFCRNKEIE